MTTETTLTARVLALRAAMVEQTRLTGSRVVVDAPETTWYAGLIKLVYGAMRAWPEVDRKAHFLRAFAEDFPCRLVPGELIVGSQRFGLPHLTLGKKWGELCGKAGFRGNMSHIVVDYGMVLAEGLDALHARCLAPGDATPLHLRNRKAFADAVIALSRLSERYADAARWLSQAIDCSQAQQEEFATVADVCARIAHHPPRTFHEALQLVWYIQILLHAEAPSSAFSFGRLDQYLWPYLERELAAGTLTLDGARELLACFWLKCCEGEEAQNLVVGGVTETGAPAENPLSLLCLEVAAAVLVWQPSVSVRISAQTSEAFWAAAMRLCQAGIGMPAFFNDPVVIRSLEILEIPTARANDYALVGCYEATPQGDTYGATVARVWSLPEILLGALEEDPEQADFPAFLTHVKAHYRQAWTREAVTLEETWERWALERPSPWESVCVRGCIESGLTVEEGGAHYSLCGINILGLGTVIDSLLVIKRLVYETQVVSLAELRAQLQADFPDRELQVQCRRLPGKYGTDTPDSNALAEDLSDFIASLVLETVFPDGARPYPGFFGFSGDIYRQVPATPDGRRVGEYLSYGCGPSTLATGTSPTGILTAAAHVAHAKAACGNPLALSLTAGDMQGEAGAQRVRQLIETYFVQGGSHLHVNVVDADRLRAAQDDPDAYPELTIRVSGYSANFHQVERHWQNALIERAARGM
jgi:pyruvate-formate lyase